MSVNVNLYQGKQQRSFENVQKLRTSDGTFWIPENGVNDSIYGEINQGLYGSVTLKNKDFIFNDTLSFLLNTRSATLNFKSNNISYGSLSAEYSNGNSILKYGTTIVYSTTGGWYDDEYKTIKVTGGTDATNPTFISWLLDFGQLPLSEKDRFYFDINLLCAAVKKESGWSENENIRNWAKHV